MKISVVRRGKYKGGITDNPDYENQAMLGTNLGIFNPEENVYLTYLVDELGLDGISTGAVLSFTAELYQRGLLDDRDTGGLKLTWGDVDSFAELIRMIVDRRGLGDLLAEGTYRTAVKISEEKGLDVDFVLRYAIQVKGLEVGAHGVRSGSDYPDGISYACSVQAGDHTSIAHPLVKGPLSELWWAFFDSAVLCLFSDSILPREVFWELFEAVTGWEMDDEIWFGRIARRMLHIQRGTLLLGGPDVAWDPILHDDNPARFYEPLSSGPMKGRAVNRDEVRRGRSVYYDAVGWDEYGVPRSEELRRFDLDDLDAKLEPVRARLRSEEDRSK